MSVQNILDDNGKIDPAYLGPAAAYGFVTNPLTAPLQCYNPGQLTNHAISEAAFVSASAIKTDNLEQLPGSLETQIRCATNIEMATGKQLDFEDNAIISIGGNAARKAFWTEDAVPLVGLAKYHIGGDSAVEYAEGTKVLTVNKPTVPPSPLLPGQGAVIHGGISAVSGGVVADADIRTNSIFIAKGAGQPRIEFQNGAGVAQMETGWSAATGRGVLRSANFEAFSDNTKKYLINYGDGIGYLGLETQGVDTEIRHYNVGASVMETRMKVEGGGVVSITGAAPGGGIKVENVITPAGNIGAPGEYLVKSGGNQIAWAASAPGTWAGTALSDLDMNGFKITDNIGNLNIQSVGTELVGTIDTGGTPKAFRFGSANNTLYLTDNTQQDVNVDDFAQFTTTQCAVPRQIRDAVNGTTITDVPLQTTPLYAGSTFSWLYSGSRNASSAFCSSTKVEVEVDVILIGSLSDYFQFAVSLYNNTTAKDIMPDNYDGVNGTTAFTGLQPAVSFNKTFFADQTVFIKFASVFACAGNFTDGDQVETRLWAMSRSGTHIVNSGRINIRVRPLTVW